MPAQNINACLIGGGGGVGGRVVAGGGVAGWGRVVVVWQVG